MSELARKRKQLRVEIRRQQFNTMFLSIRTTMIEINRCQSFISHFSHLIKEDYSAAQIITFMKKQIESTEESIIIILSYASAQILMMKKFQFWQNASTLDISELVTIIFGHLEQHIKKQRYWHPFIELMTDFLIEKWLYDRTRDDRIYLTVLEMHRFAQYYEHQEYRTFQEQIQRMLLQQSDLFQDQALSILFIALKSTPYNKLNYKSKKILYEISKQIYLQNMQKGKGQYQLQFNFILLVFQKKSIDSEEKQLFWSIMHRAIIDKRNYRQFLWVLKFQSCQNDWIDYHQSISILTIIYPLLNSIQDKSIFLKIIRSILVNELCNHKTIQNLYKEFFSLKLQVYLQHKSLISIFSQLVHYFTYPERLPYQQELVNCIQNLLLYHKSRLEDKTKKRFIYWLSSKQKISQNKLVLVLNQQEIQEFYTDLQNEQNELRVEV